MEHNVFLLVLILFSMIFAFLALGWWIGVSLGIVGFFALVVLLHGFDTVVASITFNITASYTLAACPLFIFMGQIILYSGLNARLYQGVSKWVGPIPGGLVHSNIIACSLFAATTGSSVACAATMGAVAYPEQVERGYDKRIVLGSLAAGGTLGILIPPSITMIIYGAFVSQSVGRLFMAGVVPGISTAILFMLYILVAALFRPHHFPKKEKFTKQYFLDAVLALKEVWPVLVLIVLIMGSIYGGLATPTEAGVAGSFSAVVLAALHRQMNFTVLKKAAMDTIEMMGMVILILIGANILGTAISLLKVPVMLSTAILSAGLDRMVVWLLVVVIYLFLGCFMDGISLMLLTLPVTYPLLIVTLGFDPIWFGVLLTMLVECALVTPPVGINLFVLQGVTRQKDITDVALGSLPFFGVLLVSIAIFTFFPQAVLALPNVMFAPKW